MLLVRHVSHVTCRGAVELGQLSARSLEQYFAHHRKLLWASLGLVAHVTVLPDSSIQHKVAALGITLANGIALSHDGLHLAVASSSLAKVHFYRRDPSTNDLTRDHEVMVPFMVDNLMYDDDDMLIVAGLPHYPSFMDVVEKRPGAKAPSWAVSIRPVGARQSEDPHSKATGYDSRAPLSASVIAPASSTDEVETIFQSDGSVYGASTTGLIDTRTGTFYLTGLYGGWAVGVLSGIVEQSRYVTVSGVYCARLL